ncbi:MAG: serine/threonine-protein kinase [Deltaproteobacteria bacterium]|nr:serine/threonine-protein kinase [Myxococcales bacterium]MDP3219103.1 serine/threonine-protein kinase [Deltaproteobacteria bacterium]
MAPDESTPTGTLSAGTLFGRYQIVQLIGAGGMGAVYEALHVELNKRVAVKILAPSVARIATWRTRFLREGQTAASIHHPNVTEVFDVGEQDGMLYLVMEFMEGEDLAALLLREGALTVKRAVDLLLPVCAALSVAHEQGIVHRDLKPENIFLATSRHGGLVPKLLDFGISKTPTVEPRITTADSLIGTPNYMSPEAAGGNDVDARSDQYAFGVLLYECTTGKRPYDGDQLYPLLLSIVHGEALPPRAVRPDLPEAFAEVITRSMALDPAARFSAMDDLGRALLPFASRTAQGLWHPVFGDESTAPLAASMLPVEPRYDVVTQPDIPAPFAQLDPLSRSQRHARRIPVIALFVALALALAGATLVAVARHPAAYDRAALTVPAVTPAPLDPAPAAPAPAAPSTPDAQSIVFAPPAEAPAVVCPAPADAAEPAPPPRSRVRRRAPPRLTRGSNRAPIVE